MNPERDDAEAASGGWAVGELVEQGWASPLARLGLDRDPFDPDPHAFFLTRDARRALDFVILALTQLSPLTLLLGQPGTGKTSLVEQVGRRVAGGLRIGVTSPRHGKDLFRQALAAFGVPAAPTDLGAARNHLLEFVAGCSEEGRAVLLVVDDAHLLSQEDLHELQAAQRPNEDDVYPLMLWLVGEPELRRRLEMPGLEALARRVEAVTGLGRIGAAEAADLVRHRLVEADAPIDLFEDEALEALHAAAQGVPGAVCHLASRCLALLAGEGNTRVDAALVARAADGGEERSDDPPTFGESADPAWHAHEATAEGSADEAPTEPMRDDESEAGWPAHPETTLASFPQYQEFDGLGSLEWEFDDPRDEQEAPEVTIGDVAEHAGPAALGSDAPSDLASHHPVEPEARGAGRTDAAGEDGEVQDRAEMPPLDARSPPVEPIPAAPLRLEHPIAPDAPSRGLRSSPTEQGPTVAPRRRGRRQGPESRRDGPPARRGRALGSGLLNGALVAGAAGAAIVLLTARPDPAAVSFRPEAAGAVAARASAEELFRDALRTAPSDLEAAAISYARAAIRGHDRSAYYLGQLYETGDGVPFDPARAQAWYRIAATEIDRAERGLARTGSLRPTAPDAAASTPVPLYSGRTAEGDAEFVWAGPEGARSFTLEVARDPESGVDRSRDVVTSAARLALPWEAGYWRVVAEGAGDAAMPWLPIDAGRWIEG